METNRISRRDVLHAVGLGAAAAVLPRWLFAGQGGASRPNIVFIMSDDHAAHAISCYGSRINKTPNLDRIAAGGVRFTNCFCTNSICAPSRAVILTGQYSHINGVMDNRDKFSDENVTYPKLLQKAGYETAMIGKWHLKTDPTGFDYWSVLPGQGVYHDPDFIEMGVRVKRKGYVTDLITDDAIKWIKGRPANKPFALCCQHKAPHRNWQPDAKHAHMYDNVDIPVPETFDDDYATRCEAARNQAMTVENHMTKTDLKEDPPEGLTGEALKKWKYEHYIKDYLRCIASVDDNVGRLLDFLDESGLSDNTIVVYTSDQGFFLGDHGWYDKRFMYEESLRMPFLVRYPKAAQAGSVSDAIVTNVDFAETFLDYAGVPVPATMQGRSIRPVLEGHTPADWPTAMYYHYYEYGDEGHGGWHLVRPHYGVRTQRYKLIHFYDGIDCWELYDLKKDPHEVNNVYDDPAYADKVKELKADILRLQAQYGDTQPFNTQPASAPAP